MIKPKGWDFRGIYPLIPSLNLAKTSIIDRLNCSYTLEAQKSDGQVEWFDFLSHMTYFRKELLHFPPFTQ